jgi:serine/threonine-protein kinase RsbW
MPAEEITLSADYSSLSTLALALRHYLTVFELDESWVYSFDLALCEAATNIIRHGYQEQPGFHYRVRFSHTSAAVTVTLYDSGTAIPELQLTPAKSDEQNEEVTLDTLSESGRGMPLIFACIDRAIYLPGGSENQFSLIKQLPPAAH